MAHLAEKFENFWKFEVFFSCVFFVCRVILGYSRRILGGKKITDCDQEIFLQLPRKGKLNDGDILSTNQCNFFIEIIAKKENLIEISSNSKLELIKTAYHLGNRHVEVEINENILLTKSDYVIENMLNNFNVDIVNTQKKFFPETGAHNHE